MSKSDRFEPITLDELIERQRIERERCDEPGFDDLDREAEREAKALKRKFRLNKPKGRHFV